MDEAESLDWGELNVEEIPVKDPLDGMEELSPA